MIPYLHSYKMEIEIWDLEDWRQGGFDFDRLRSHMGVG